VEIIVPLTWEVDEKIENYERHREILKSYKNSLARTDFWELIALRFAERVLIIEDKAHPEFNTAKNQVQLILCLIRNLVLIQDIDDTLLQDAEDRMIKIWYKCGIFPLLNYICSTFISTDKNHEWATVFLGIYYGLVKDRNADYLFSPNSAALNDLLKKEQKQGLSTNAVRQTTASAMFAVSCNVKDVLNLNIEIQHVYSH
jgi:hypothetical protein